VPLPVWQIGLILMMLLTAVNLMSTRSYGEFEFWFASLKVTAIALFIAVGLAFVLGSGGSRVAAIANLHAGGFAPHGAASIFAGVTTVIFALCGSEIATIAAAESAEPAQTIARLTMSIAFRITLFFIGSMVVIVAIVPWNEITPGISPFTTVLDRIGVPGAALIMKLIVLTAVLSCLNSGVYISSRMLFTLAAHGDAPQWLIALNGRRVPVRAIAAGSLFGFGAVIASIVSPQRLFAFLVNASGANMLIIYLLVTAAEIRLRYAVQRRNPGRIAAVAMWWFPWLSYAVIGAIMAVLAAMLLQRELAAQLYASLCALGVALMAYWVVRRHSERAGRVLRREHSSDLPTDPP
jgi:GABA permease